MTGEVSAAWDDLGMAIARARECVGAEAPDQQTAAEGEAYVARVVSAALAPGFLGHRLLDGGLSIPLPVYGGPNPDYIMRHAMIDPGGRYRVEGQLNGSERVGIGLYIPGRSGAPLIAGYAAFEPEACGPGGNFTLDIGPGLEGPGALSLQPGTRILMFRVLHRDASTPAHIRVTGLAEQSGPSLVTGSCEGALSHVARTVQSNIAEYMKWVRAARNLPNQLAPAPDELAETVVGDADTQYFLGGFDLAEGEWLEVTMPAGLTGYWSLHAYNYWYEHLVTPGVHDRNAVPQADGTVRIAVGPQTPDDAINRIDTLGRRKGAFVCRLVGQGRTGIAPQARLARP